MVTSLYYPKLQDHLCGFYLNQILFLDLLYWYAIHIFSLKEGYCGSHPPWR